MQTLEREGQGFPAGTPGEFLDHPEEYEEQLPLLKRTLGFVRQYETAKPKGRQTLLDKLGDDIVKNPAHLAPIINNLDLIGEFRSQETVEEIKSRMVPGLEQAVRRSSLRSWIPEKIEQLVRLSIDSQGAIKDAYQHFEGALFNSARTVEDAVDVQYNAAWAMITSDDPDVKEEICAMLCFERIVFKPDSMAAYLGLCANSGLTDDVHVQRYVVTNQAVSEVLKLSDISKGEMVPKRSPRADYRRTAVGESFVFLPQGEQLRRTIFVEKLIEKYSARYKKFQDTKDKTPAVVLDAINTPSLNVLEDVNYRDETERLRRLFQALENLEWPENLFYGSQDPLTQYLVRIYGPKAHAARWEDCQHYFLTRGYAKLTEEPVQITEDLNLEIIGKGYDSPEQKSVVIRQIFDAIQGGTAGERKRETLGMLGGAIEAARILDGLIALRIEGIDAKFSISHRLSGEESGRLSSILQYHRPVISIDQAKNVVEHVSQVRKDIKTSFTRSVGVRGFEHIVSDPALTSFGYRSVSFRLDETKRNIYTTINIMGRDYSFLLDEDYRIILGDDVKDFRSLQDQTWLELLVLSHLKKIMCTEEADIKNELVGGEKQDVVYRQQTLNRSEHLRRLTPGQKPSNDAFGRCLKSDLPVKDLSLINRGRASIGFGGTIDTGMWTYVSPVEKVDTQTAKPVKISFATATDDMRKVIPLGEISTEELERIEKEILGDFENL